MMILECRDLYPADPSMKLPTHVRINETSRAVYARFAGITKEARFASLQELGDALGIELCIAIGETYRITIEDARQCIDHPRAIASAMRADGVHGTVRPVITTDPAAPTHPDRARATRVEAIHGARPGVRQENLEIPADVRVVLALIASRRLGIGTLESRGSDRLDFHDISVVGLQAALHDAFRAGQANARTVQA